MADTSGDSGGGAAGGAETEAGKLDEVSFESSAFEALERDFQEVLSELVGDKSLERFRVEYEKLHRALKRSQEQEKRLIKKCRELNAQIVSNAMKVQTALKLSTEDQNTITSLKKEIEKAWKMVDASHEKELRAKETIQQLNAEITNLARLVEQGAGLSIGQDNTVKELLKVRDELTARNEEQASQLRAMSDKLDEAAAREEEMAREAATMAAEMQGLQDMLATKKAEQEREQRRRERLDKEYKDLKTELESKTKEYGNLNTEVTRSYEQVSKLEGQLREAKSTMDKHFRDQDQLYQRTKKLTSALDDMVQQCTALDGERAAMEEEVKRKQEEINRMNQEKAAMTRRIEKERKKQKTLENRLGEERTQRDMLQAEISALKKELDAARVHSEGDRKHIDDLTRDREIQQKQLMRADEAVKHQVSLVSISERTTKNLEKEVRNLRTEAGKGRKIIQALEKDREKSDVAAAEAHQKFLSAREEIKLKDMHIEEMRKKVADGETRLNQQQAMYEQVRSDRNLYSKNLIEAKDEIAEMRRKFKIMQHQIEQLKDEISSKDAALVKEHFEHVQVEKKAETQLQMLERLRKLMKKHDQTIGHQDQELRKMATTITRLDEEAAFQRQEFDQAIAERDILGTQLIRRNDELALLYEKLKVQRSTLTKGEVQYRERMNDIRLLTLKIKDLKRELLIAKRKAKQTESLKREVIRLQRELLQEKTKVKALSEELENPMNIHRWRALAGSDPATYEMIQKIQTLQKRLIAKTEEAVEKDLVIKEKDKLYVELKAILARQPGPEVAEQLSVYQEQLKTKTRMMKAMASELNMYQAQVNEYKYEVERLTRELQGVKRKYYDRKKKDAIMREAARSMGGGGTSGGPLAPPLSHTAPGPATEAPPRFTGGGFSLHASRG